MSKKLLSNAECSICLMTYQPPIRMLPCGHNFCEFCLINLPTTSKQKISCPKCRKLVKIGSEGFSELPRCHDLENIIEDLKKMDVTNKLVNIITKQGNVTDKHTQKSLLITNLYAEALFRLGDSVMLKMDSGDYQDALLALPSIIHSQKGLNKVLPMIDKPICHIEVGQKEPIVASIESATLVEFKETTNEMDLLKNKIFEKLKNLTEKFFKFNYSVFDSNVSLASCLQGCQVCPLLDSQSFLKPA